MSESAGRFERRRIERKLRVKQVGLVVHEVSDFPFPVLAQQVRLLLPTYPIKLVDEVGELVITQPMPSMPLYFWNDADGQRYRESYFSEFPGVWRHGDWIKVTPHGSAIIYGRSDSTINRGGVRHTLGPDYRTVFEDTGFCYTEEQDIDGDYDGAGGGAEDVAPVRGGDRRSS